RLPARTDPRLRGRHDCGVVDHDVDRPPGREEPVRERLHAFEVAQIHLLDLDPRNPTQRLTRSLRPTGRYDDVRAGLRQRLGRLQTEPGISTGDDGQLAGEVDAGQDVVSGAVVPETRADLVLCCHDFERMS